MTFQIAQYPVVICWSVTEAFVAVRVWFSVCCTGLFGWFGAALKTFFLFRCFRETLVVSKVLGGFFFSSETVSYRLMGPIESSRSVNSYPGSIGPFSKVQKNGQQKTCNLFCNIAAKRVEYRCCAFYHPHKTCLATNQVVNKFEHGCKTRNIAIQPVLQQCYKTSCTFFVARFSVPAVLWSASTSHVVDAASPRSISIDKKKNVLWNPG